MRSSITQFDIEHILKEIAYLFETYTVLEGKNVEVLGWEDAEAAKTVIKRCQGLYERWDAKSSAK